MTRRSEQLEQEAEQTRHELSATLDELLTRASPGHVMDQFVSYAREGGGADFFRNFGRQVRDNPIPTVLVGAGMAWLMMANNRPASSGMGGRAGGQGLMERAGAAASDAGTSVWESSQMAMDRLGAAAASGRTAARDASDRVADAVGRAGDAVSSAYASASGTAAAMAQSTASFGRSSVSTGRSVYDFLRDQPLVLGAIGLAIGAVLGAALPASEAENRLMGDASDELKQRASEAAREQTQRASDKLAEAARETADQAKSASEPQAAAATDADRTEERFAHPSIVPTGEEASLGEQNRVGATQSGSAPQR